MEPLSILSNVSAYALQNISHNNVIIVSNSNTGYVHLSYNLWLSYVSLAITNILFVSEDIRCGEILAELVGRNHVVYSSSNLAYKTTGTIFRDPAFGKLVKIRPYYILTVLQKGFHVLWQDSDSVIFQNPFSLFNLQMPAFVSDSPVYSRTNFGTICTCFMYFPKNSYSERLIKLWMHSILLSNEHTNQRAFNSAYSRMRKGSTSQYIGQTYFPCGKLFDQFNHTAVWYHANWMRGVLNKSNRMRSRGFLNPKAEALFHQVSASQLDSTSGTNTE